MTLEDHPALLRVAEFSRFRRRDNISDFTYLLTYFIYFIMMSMPWVLRLRDHQSMVYARKQTLRELT